MRFALLALLGVALAVHHSLDLFPLKPRNEYVFRFEGDVHSGIPLPTDTTVSRIHAMVHVQIRDDHHAILKLRDVRFATGEDDRKELFKPIDDLKMRTISREHMELLEMPVRFVYKSGMVSDLIFSDKDETWSTNVKRSVINMLQLNLHKTGRTDEPKMEIYEVERDNDYFTVNERTIEGDCDVAYTVLKKNDFVTENAKRRISLSQALSTPTFIEKDELKKVEVRSQYTITINNEAIMKTEICTRLILEDVKKIRREFEWVNGKKETLIYNNEVEKQIERFFMYGDDAEVLPYEPVKDKMEAISTVIDEMKKMKENKHETTHLLSRLVSLFRMLSLDELSNLHTEIYMNDCAPAQDYPGDAHTHRRISSTNLSASPKPTLFSALLSSAKLFGLPLDLLCEELFGRTMDKTFVKEDRRELKRRYLDIMMKVYEKADTIYEKVLILKSLANAGIDLSVYELEKIILNKREELPVRMEAIDALRLLKDVMPRKIQSILMPIISTMEREPNQQVAAFTYDLLHSFVKSTHVCYKKLAAEILPLLTMTRYQRRERGFTSTYKYLPLFKEEIMTGVNVDFATIFGKNTVWPKELMVKLDTVLSGMWSKYFFQFGISQQNIEKILNKLTQKLMKMEKTTNTVVRGRRIRESLTLLKDIAKKLDIRPRVVDDRTPYAMLYIRRKDMDYAVLPIDEKIIDELVEKFIRNGRLERTEIDRFFNREREFQLNGFTFLHEVIRKTPTTLGLPLIMKCKLPTVVSAEGEFTVEMIPTGLRFRLNTVPSIVTTQLCEMRLWNPLLEQGVRIMRSLEAHLPIDVDMEINYRNGFEITKTFNIPTEEKTLVRYTSRPMTFFRFLSGQKSFGETELRTIVLPKWRQLNTEKEMVYNIWGLKTVLRGNWLRNWNMRNLLLGEHDWEFIVIPTREAPKKIRLFLNSERIEKVRLDKVDFTHLVEKEFEVEKNEYESYEERDRRENFHRHLRDIERRDGHRHRLLMKIEAVDSNVEQYGNVEITTICDEELRYCKNTSGRQALSHRSKVIVDYELTPYMKNLFERIYNYVKGYTFWHSKVTKLNRDNDRLFLKVRVDPITRELVNVMLETPYERMEVVDLVVPQLYLPNIAKRTLRDIRYEVNEPVCEVKNTKVRTFDDVIFRAPLTKCYSVIAKDCSEEPRFVVMKLKIINEREQVIIVEIVDNRLKVSIDDEKINKEELEKYNIEMIEDDMVRVRLEDLMVHFDGYNVKVYMGKHMTERQCGLCGHFDEEKDNEFLTPRKEYTDDIMEFHHSYILKDQCDVEKDLPREKKHYRMEKREESEENDEDWLDFLEGDDDRNGRKRTYKYKSEDRMEDKDEEMLEKTHVIEFTHRVCFSLEPVRMCRKNKEMDEVIDKKVRFTCLPRSSRETRQLLHKVRNNVLDLKHYPVSFVDTIQVPQTCTVY
ncbi:von Willebrand factor type D domain protein [Cooperia oncophora]